jgi:hypothetical protein
MAFHGASAIRIRTLAAMMPMIETLTADGYEQAKEKLRDLETRLAEIE